MVTAQHRILTFLLFVFSFSASSYATAGETMVHLFEWPWSDVATECENFLGPKGFDAVQVSPPNEHVILPGRPWYERYQLVSYKIDSRSGSREEFKRMIDRCHTAGVKIYVDTVINHTIGLDLFDDKEVILGSAGTKAYKYSHPGIYSPNDFHYCNKNGWNNPIRDYGDKWEVQHCNLVYLADLKTSFWYVQQRIADFLNDLLELGVDGFRVDGAKHIPANELGEILHRLDRPAYIFSEVIDHGNEPIKAKEYFHLGNVTEFLFGESLSGIFRQGKLAWLKNFGSDWGFMPSHKAIVFVDNHDNQRGHGSGANVITHREPEMYSMANVFMLAWPYGSPRLMSSFRFENDRQGPPQTDTRVLGPYDQSGNIQCFGSWACEHRWFAIANMVGFRKVVGNSTVKNWWTNGNNQIAFSRGSHGFVAINNEDSVMEVLVKTAMPSGVYCNILSGNYDDRFNRCSGDLIRVSSEGMVYVTVNPKASIAIHRLSKVAEINPDITIGFSR